LEEKILISKTYKNQIVHRSISAILGCETKFWDKIKTYFLPSIYGILLSVKFNNNKILFCSLKEASSRPRKGAVLPILR